MNFIDLREQYRRYKAEIDTEMGAVLSSGQFIQGESLRRFEEELARHAGVNHAIGCSSGTDALLLILMLLGIGPGDEVIVPDFTFFATAEVVSFLGARPVFVDIKESTYNIDPARAEEAITPRTRAILAVSLYGQCADYDELLVLAKRHGVQVVEDAAQSYGAMYRGRRSCSLTPLAATSFYPAKPLGAYGDAGALFTNDDSLAVSIRMLLNHGQSGTYNHQMVGINGRLDTLQAAVLRVKLRHFDAEIQGRRRAADAYGKALAGTVVLPTIEPWNRPVWAQYTVRTPHRARLIESLKADGIPTAVHYPSPLHRQPAYASLSCKDPDFPVSCRASGEVVSLPMHPFLTEDDIGRVADAVRKALA